MKFSKNDINKIKSEMAETTFDENGFIVDDELNEMKKYPYKIIWTCIESNVSYCCSGWDYKEDAQDSLDEILEFHPTNQFKARIIKVRDISPSGGYTYDLKNYW